MRSGLTGQDPAWQRAITVRSSRHIRRRSGKRAGDVPGTLHVDPEAPPPKLTVLAYGPDGFDRKSLEDVQEVRGLSRTFPVTWVNVDGLGDAGTIKALGEIFSLHALALEDVASVPQRSKVEQYEGVLFIVTRMSFLTDQIETEQLSMFLGQGFVLTFQERSGDCLDPVRERIRKGAGRIRREGADYLAYAILDAVIDSYFPLLEKFGERLEALEDRVVAQPNASTVAAVHQAKRDLLGLRRAIWPQREMVNALLRDEMPLMGQQVHVYLRDCYDHVTQIIDMVETYREIASGLLDAYQSNISNRMNEIMKLLTIIATIFIPLSFVAGVWGMNFSTEKSSWNMPELNWAWGYPSALLLMALIAGGMLVFFRRKGWLGSSPPVDDHSTAAEEGPSKR